MSFANEAARSLASAIGIVRREPAALDGFNLTIQGFWRSFAVIVAVIPASWVLVAAADRLALESSEIAAHLTLVQGSLYVIAFSIAWPVGAAMLARAFGLGAHYLRYMIAYNWLSVPLSGLLIVPNLAYLAGIIGAGLCSALGFVAYGITLFYCLYLARIAFETRAAIALAFLLADLTLSIALSYLVAL
jgi:hypothetical protein